MSKQTFLDEQRSFIANEHSRAERDNRSDRLRVIVAVSVSYRCSCGFETRLPIEIWNHTEVCYEALRCDSQTG